jgi:hypothetical protein
MLATVSTDCRTPLACNLLTAEHLVNDRKTIMTLLQKIVLAATCLTSGLASASLVPTSYDMLNGNTGSYVYQDESYTGAGCVSCDNAALTGGRGDLTDGVVAGANWYDMPGQYVGWTLDPTIVFHWTGVANIDSITFYLDDADGYGGVSAPASITVNGSTYAVTNPAGSAPFSFTLNNLGFTGSDLSITLNRSDAWVFLSEVAFDGQINQVPEPASGLLLALGLGLMAARSRSKRA